MRALLGVSALLFAGSAAVTIAWCTSMSAMGGMPMPGGWSMSMAWMRMPGQTWPGAATSFIGTWVVMMVAMMMPSLVLMLGRYRQAVGRPAASAPPSPLGRRRGETRVATLTAIVCAGYLLVWTVFGMAVFPLGAALAAIEMQQLAVARAVPIAAGVVVLIGGALQFTAWKARHLAGCREAPGRGRTLPADVGTAWRHGLRLGLHCSYCCAGLMAILLAIGVMDLRAMAAVAAAITVERLAPAGDRVRERLGPSFSPQGRFSSREQPGSDDALPKERQQPMSVSLSRRFGLLQATALNMSNMIGVGPFITIPLLMSRWAARRPCSGGSWPGHRHPRRHGVERARRGDAGLRRQYRLSARSVRPRDVRPADGVPVHLAVHPQRPARDCLRLHRVRADTRGYIWPAVVTTAPSCRRGRVGVC